MKRVGCWPAAHATGAREVLGLHADDLEGACHQANAYRILIEVDPAEVLDLYAALRAARATPRPAAPPQRSREAVDGWEALARLLGASSRHLRRLARQRPELPRGARVRGMRERRWTADEIEAWSVVCPSRSATV